MSVTYTPLGGQPVVWNGQPMPGSANANPSAAQQAWNQWGGWNGAWQQGAPAPNTIVMNPGGGYSWGGSSANYNTGGSNPNTGGGNDVSMGFQPTGGSAPLGGANPAAGPGAMPGTGQYGVAGSQGGGLGVDPLGAIDWSGQGNWQDYFQQQYPDTIIQNAIEAAGGSYNIADPVIQQMERMAPGLTNMFALGGGTFDPSAFDPFVTNYANAALGGGGNTASFGDVQQLMSNVFGGGGVSDLMFAEAFGPRGAGSASDIISSMLGSTLPFAMPLPLIGGVMQSLDQATNDYVSNYVNSIGPGQSAMNFIDFLGQSGFGDIFGF